MKNQKGVCEGGYSDASEIFNFSRLLHKTEYHLVLVLLSLHTRDLIPCFPTAVLQEYKSFRNTVFPQPLTYALVFLNRWIERPRAILIFQS